MVKYRIDENSVLSIENHAINKMMRYCQKQGMNESGGILLGRVRTDYSEFTITDVSEPCRNDKSGRCFFIRNKENAQRIIYESWKQSKGEVNYLGEWHTHPVLNPTPSYVDKQLLDKCLNENQYPFKGLFMIIVGRKGKLFVGYKTKDMVKYKKLLKDK